MRSAFTCSTELRSVSDRLLAIRVPGADVGGVELEDAEAQVQASEPAGEESFSTTEGTEGTKKINPWSLPCLPMFRD